MNKYLEIIELFQKDAQALNRDASSVEELKKWVKESKEELLKTVRLDIHSISDELYDLILKAFKEQFGEGYYDEWVISAVKEEEE